jgi:hypothetical protein
VAIDCVKVASVVKGVFQPLGCDLRKLAVATVGLWLQRIKFVIVRFPISIDCSDVITFIEANPMDGVHIDAEACIARRFSLGVLPACHRL